MAELTVTEGLRAYARMLNTLDADALAPLLAPDFLYVSQWVMEELRGREVFLDYLRKKLAAIRASGTPHWAEMAELHVYPCGPCVVIASGHRDNLVATVLLDVEGGFITGITLCCVPPPTAAVRSGEWPGCGVACSGQGSVSVSSGASLTGARAAGIESTAVCIGARSRPFLGSIAAHLEEG